MKPLLTPDGGVRATWHGPFSLLARTPLIHKLNKIMTCASTWGGCVPPCQAKEGPLPRLRRRLSDNKDQMRPRNVKVARQARSALAVDGECVPNILPWLGAGCSLLQRRLCHVAKWQHASWLKWHCPKSLANQPLRFSSQASLPLCHFATPLGGSSFFPHLTTHHPPLATHQFARAQPISGFSGLR
jgi:hypothetical protein